jgi:hypothetical protein
LTAILQFDEELKTLIREGYSCAGLLMGWSTFEALGRTSMPDDFARPQSPGRLLQLLAQEGYVTPGEASHEPTLPCRLLGGRSALDEQVYYLTDLENSKHIETLAKISQCLSSE